MPLETPAAGPTAKAAAARLCPRLWDPLTDPSPWLRVGESPASSPRTTQPPAPRRNAREAAAHPPDPPLVLRIDAAAWTLERLERSPLWGWLTPQERQKAERLRRPEDRLRHLLGRAGLRRLLGLWRLQEPARVPIQQGSHGKPCCPEGPQFNLSHSGDLILLACHATWPVGVDGERLRPELGWRPLACRLFADRECRVLEHLPAADQPGAFLQAWCRLEARLKARGLGLAGLEALRRQAELDPALLEASPDGAQARVGGLGLDGGEQLWDLRLPEGYSGALACLAVEG